MSNIRRNILERICRDFDIDILYVFGNRAKEVMDWVSGKKRFISPDSLTIEIGVRPIPGKRLRFRERVFLKVALQSFLGVNKVNLVVIPESNPFLAANIIHGERLFFRNEYEADEYELYILRRVGKFSSEKQRSEFIFGKN